MLKVILFSVLIACSLGEEDINVLQNFYKALHGNEWKVNSGWDDLSNVCHFSGVYCGGEVKGHPVQQLLLSDNELRGTIPDISQLLSLQVLDLSYNTIDGKIPDIESLHRMTIINLSNNRLGGSIPSWFGGFAPLVSVNLAGNQLTGEIPQSFENAQLFDLQLQNNRLTGLIPNLNVDLLHTCDLTGNKFSCPIPPQVKAACNVTCV